jgi:hypothetical protein
LKELLNYMANVQKGRGKQEDVEESYKSNIEIKL